MCASPEDENDKQRKVVVEVFGHLTPVVIDPGEAGSAGVEEPSNPTPNTGGTAATIAERDDS
jgi:hypothetical protein